LLKSVDENTVTLVLGGTGCGKSTQVPQMLLAAAPRGRKRRVVVSQPRRLAAMAVAQHVALEQRCDLGGAVGVHIGQRNDSGSDTKVVFVTAGLLLEQIKKSGEEAFEDVFCFVIDEVHERSVESDLILAAVRRML
ncbi:P-loop containing nucleoside triphosphate hydrolase protein, partial [Pelagophyceae sp. CCMP2097]